MNEAWVVTVWDATGATTVHSGTAAECRAWLDLNLDTIRGGDASLPVLVHPAD